MKQESGLISFSTLLVERRDNGLVIVTLNRPEMANAVNTDMGIELLDVWAAPRPCHALLVSVEPMRSYWSLALLALPRLWNGAFLIVFALQMN